MKFVVCALGKLPVVALTGLCPLGSLEEVTPGRARRMDILCPTETACLKKSLSS